MRLGGPIYQPFQGPDEWVAVLRGKGYAAAYCPLDEKADDATVRAYAKAAADADIVIAEVGAWSNPLDRDPVKAKAALELCTARLALADRIGANCCVNIAGSLGPKWDGPFADDLNPGTFDLIVESVRKIIDAVKPSRSAYSLETMPWMCPESPDDYLRLVKAIDRRAFKVHLDPVNMINSPIRHLLNTAFLRECFEKLGSQMVGVHIKDTAMTTEFTAVIRECRPGLGTLDYVTLLREAEKISPDLPLCLEHLPTAEEYDLAAEYVRQQATKAGVAIKLPR